jgi:hypothetical protein
MPCFEATLVHFASNVLISDVDQEFIIAMYILNAVFWSNTSAFCI